MSFVSDSYREERSTLSREKFHVGSDSDYSSDYYYERSSPSKSEYNQYRKDVHARKASDLRITAFALALLAVLMFVISLTMMGVGALPPTTIFGLGMVGTLGGMFFGLISGLILCGAAVTGVAAWIQSRRSHSTLTS